MNPTPGGKDIDDLMLDRDQHYKSYLQVLMSYVSDDGSVGQETLNLSHRRRLTHQFISALITCGVPRNAPVLQRSLSWLIESKERDESTPEEHYVVLDKIEAAIEMGEADGDFCKRALPMLLKRKRGPVEFDIPGRTWTQFFALWTAKILIEHPRTRDYKEQIDDLLQVFTSAYKTLRPRDLSLLINLCARHWPEDHSGRDSLKDMIDTLTGMCHDGLFEVPGELGIRMKDLRKHGLTPDLISGLQKELYWSLVSTCYIVTNLAFLRPMDGDLSRKVGYSERTLFAILFQSPYKLEALFPMSYHQIMLTARSLIAFATVTGDDIARSTLPVLLQELVERDRSKLLEEKAGERKRLQRVIKEWLTIDWEDNGQERLGGGYSGAAVVRIKPKLRIPADTASGFRETALPNLDSAIIKFGRKVDLDRERLNFESVPPEFRNVFASIPSRAYKEIVDDEVYEYLVIEDLMGFKTLQEVLPGCTVEFREHLTSRLVDFLRMLYTMPIIPLETTGMIRHLYVTPMFRSLETIHQLKQKISSLDHDDFKALEALQILIGASQELDKFPPTVMHGDLNIRNVLVHGRQASDAELRFRLIDMDKFSRCGDFAYDIGEIVVDNEHVCRSNRFPKDVLGMSESIANTFAYYAQTRADSGYLIRFDLAKARSLLKVADIRARVGLSNVGKDPVSDRNAQQIMSEVGVILRDAYSLLGQAKQKAQAMK
jgi:aminoglycoside phosphotransferase (APT) family kinase protein